MFHIPNKREKRLDELALSKEKILPPPYRQIRTASYERYHGKFRGKRHTLIITATQAGFMDNSPWQISVQVISDDEEENTIDFSERCLSEKDAVKVLIRLTEKYNRKLSESFSILR